MNVVHVVGARPNFMKVAPVMAALGQCPRVRQRLVHTGQHYDQNMSQVFFDQLGIAAPDFDLGVGSGSHALQTAQIMIKFEEVVLRERPDWVVVYGDVNSTVAAALVAAKLSISVAHVEAGLRSGDRRMPEEINRLLTDQLADLLFTPSEDGNQNLAREGVAPSKVHTVGNVMIDTLVRLLPQARPPELPGLTRPYGLVTLHRPSNVDDPQVLRRIMETLLALSRDLMLVFPIHPRTRKRVEDAGRAIPAGGRLLLLEPIGYLEMLGLQRDALAVITDSGGIQEETTYLGVPCLTLRENTERPITVTQGTNRLFGNDMLALEQAVRRLLAGERLPGRVPPLWDGHAGERIASVLTATA